MQLSAEASGGATVAIDYDDEKSGPAVSEKVAEFGDRGSADAIAGILEGESVHAKVEPAGNRAGLPSCYRVLVDARQLQRARWILQDTNLTDRELAFLATGQSGEEPE
jgi:hypothetical protein